MPERVRITEVGPRDGLQNESGIIPTAQKVRLVELCCATGVDEIEVSSFVSPKWIPQLGDAAAVFGGVSSAKPPGLEYSALVPNEKGLESALAINSTKGHRLIDKVSVFTAASETFSLKNTNASIDETFERFVPVIEQAHAAGLRVRGYVSCAFSCPFEGPIEPFIAAHIAARLFAIGADEIDLGDTIGAATPSKTTDLINALYQVLGWLPGDAAPRGPFSATLHFHDTFGRASECVKAALDLGIRSFDSSVAGLGGCPYASTSEKRAPGNIATETLVRTIHDAGYDTGVKLDKLATAADFARTIVAESRAAGANA
jgi:hydroxymethylglutaryl-CoA lyase